MSRYCCSNNNYVIVELDSKFVLMLTVAKWLWLRKSHEDILAQLQNEAKVIDDTALLSVEVTNNKNRLLNIYIQEGLPLWQIILGNSIKIELCLVLAVHHMNYTEQIGLIFWIAMANISELNWGLFLFLHYSVFKICWTVVFNFNSNFEFY